MTRHEIFRNPRVPRVYWGYWIYIDCSAHFEAKETEANKSDSQRCKRRLGRCSTVSIQVLAKCETNVQFRLQQLRFGLISYGPMAYELLGLII